MDGECTEPEVAATGSHKGEGAQQGGGGCTAGRGEGAQQGSSNRGVNG